MTKYIIHGYRQVSPTYTRNDKLAYLYETMEEALTACKRNNPTFIVEYVTIEA